VSYHKCHAYLCDKPVEPRMLMCKKHWSMVPMEIQVRVKKYYRVGQCGGGMRPHPEWMKAAREAINHVTKAEGNWEIKELTGGSS
jgi:hypothetical protein